ncbi:MAG: hypothetical protein Q8P18_06890 [Pseudomonadota bacterium]|nr:hypothetical protein [Pseudomonadota bacterium]
MFTAPETFEAEDGWQFYTNAPAWDLPAVADLAPGDATPEAAVVHFYASRMRKDLRWEEVLPAVRSDVLVRKLARMEGWTIRTLRLVARKQRSDRRWYVKVHLDLLRDGKEVAFRDDATVERDGDRWVVTRPPT